MAGRAATKGKVAQQLSDLVSMDLTSRQYDKPPKGRAPHSQITHHTKRRTYRTPDLYNVHMFYS